MTLSLSRRLLIALLGILGMIATAHAASTVLADSPVLATSQVPPNVMLTLSVEWPTGTVAAYGDNQSSVTGLECPGRDGSYGICYFASRTYLGYFDPLKCYSYSVSNSYFSPVSVVALGASCGGSSWSGNYLNWVESHAIDEFRYALTGGDRFIDTATNTVVEKAIHTGQGGYAQFPVKRIQSTAYTGGTPNVPAVLPSTVSPQSWPTMYARVTNDTTPLALGSTTRVGRVMQFANNTAFINAFPSTMQYIKIQLGGTNNLSLAEVQVYGASTANWTRCAAENGTCTFPTNSTAVEVRFGANGTYFTQVFTSTSTGCNNGVFGDPTPTVVKACDYRVLPSTDLAASIPFRLLPAATQSSTYLLNPASNAIDGNTDGNYYDGSITHTAATAANDWWQVNLGSPQAVRAIVIWNRTDCCSDRLTNFYVYGSNYDMSNSSIDTLLADTSVWKYMVVAQPNPSTIIAPDPTYAATDYLSGRVQVCNNAIGLESNCKAYGSNYKPTGIIENNADKMRFGVVSYLNVDGENTFGGVLRSGMKYVGPNVIVPNGNPRTNSQAEIDTGGLLVKDPQGLVAGDIQYTGAINYLNKFGKLGPKTTLKSNDMVSELYYEALNYMRGSPLPTQKFIGYTGANTAAARDGFPAYSVWTPVGSADTPSWADNVPGIQTIDKRPIQYSCQKNYFVGIGDTNTWCDSYAPGNSASARNNTACPDHNGAPTDTGVPNVITLDNTVGTNEANNSATGLSGGTTLGSSFIPGGRGDTFDIAGYAFWANTQDILPDSAGNSWTTGRQTAQTYWVDVRETGSFNGNTTPKNQYWLAGKYGGFAAPPAGTPNPETYASSYDPLNKNYFTGDRPDTLISSLQSVFTSILAKQQSNSAAAFTSNNLSSGGADYLVQYDPSTWTGEITAQTAAIAAGSPTTSTSGSTTVTTAAPSTVTAAAVWTSAAQIDATMDSSSPVFWNGKRRILTYNTTTKTGASFEPQSGTGYMSATQLAYFGTGYSDLINYLRGQTTYETGASAKFRARAHQLGDIVDSTPVVVGAPSDGFTEANNPGYTAFATSYQTRSPVLYVGSNDGMMHAIDARVNGSATTNGDELWAYVPSLVLSGPSSPATPFIDGIASRSVSPMVHKFLVDGQITVQNVDFGNTGGPPSSARTPDWHTLLVGGLGKGGRGFYALDVTADIATASPSPTEASLTGKVLWEYTDTDMGYSYGQPVIVKTARSGWVVILSSGYNNTASGQTGQGWIVVLNAKTGAVIQKISTTASASTTNPAGLAQLSAFIPDRTDYTADSVYGGDLLGNIWRFDLTGTGSYPAPTLMTTLGSTQPITVAPAIGITIGSLQRWVFFGTGQLLSSSDQTTSATQSLYAIKDGLQSAFTPASSYPFTARSASAMSPVTNLTVGTTAGTNGWYYDFTGSGERMVTDMNAQQGILAFATQTPTTDPCSPGVSSNIYALNYTTGQSDFVTTSTTTTTANNSSTSVKTTNVIPYISTTAGVFGVEVVTDSAGSLQVVTTQSSGSSGTTNVVIPGSTNVNPSGTLVKLNWREILQ